MKKTAIIADSTCDLSPELIEQFNITIIPLHVHLNEEEYRDGIDITPDRIFSWSDSNKLTPKTSAFSPYEAEEMLKKIMNDNDEVIVFCISEEMSSAVNVMRMTAGQSDFSEKIHVIDSRNLSTGIGLQVLAAADMINEGLTAVEIVDNILSIQSKVRASFVVDTLTYLYRGGRCSGLAALAGGTLKLHPHISVINGVMQSGKKYRGKMSKVIYDYIQDLKPDLLKARKDRVFITHSSCEPELIEIAINELNELNYFDKILETNAGCVVSSHCGPGTLGVLFISE